MKVVDLVMKEEGFVPHAYKDSLGYLTIGYGRLIDESKGGGISKDEARMLLRNDLVEIEEQLAEKIPWYLELNGPRRAVLISMAYQMGVSGLLRFKNTLAAIQEGDYDRGARGMMASLWARQTPGRAKRHAEIMRLGRFG